MEREYIEGFRLSPQQSRLWLLQKTTGDIAYRAQCAILIEGWLEIPRLQAALERIIERHEILRTTFHCLPGMTLPVQVINDQRSYCYSEMSVNLMGEEEQQIEIEKLFSEELCHPLDFKNGPLVVAKLVALTPQKHVLFISLPALYADSISLKNLVYELSLLYEDGLTDEVIQYADISEIFSGFLEDQETEVARGYWKQQGTLALDSLKLPFEQNSVESELFIPDILQWQLNREIVTKLESMAIVLNTSISLLLLAGWQSLMYRFTGQSDIMIGLIFAGRTFEGLESVPGLFAKILPISCHYQDSSRLSDICDQLSRAEQEASEWQDYFDLERVSDRSNNISESVYFPFYFEFIDQILKYSKGGVSFSICKHYSCFDRFKIKLSCLHQT
ncbi:MAG: condensation domain-containing protein, partial [Acidobacteriota bacterium]